MSSLQAQREHLEKEWNTACDSNSISTFFESNKTELLSYDTPWFLNKLFEKDDIQSVKYILQHSDPTKYINLQPHNGGHILHKACSCSSFEMIRLIVSNGVIFDEKKSHLLEYVLRNKKLIKNNNIYLCIEYLLNNLDFTLYCRNTIFSFSSAKPIWEFDRIQICNLIKSKRTEFSKTLSTYKMCVGLAVYNGYLDFAEYLMKQGQQLSSSLYVKCHVLFPSDSAIKWLLRKNVDINRIIDDTQNGYCTVGLTPLFQCCVNKKYDIIELLLKNGADINKSCSYNGATMTSLEYIKKEFSKNHCDYFCSFGAMKEQNTLCGVDLSQIPKTPLPANLTFEEDVALNQFTNRISDLEQVLNQNYNELKSLYMKRTELMNKKQNIEQWKSAKNVWDDFLCKWERWDIGCFVEYLKRIIVSFDKYYSSDEICKDKIESYFKNNVQQVEEKVNDEHDKHFGGIYLRQFDESVISGIGITSANDIKHIYTSLKALTATKEQKEKIQSKDLERTLTENGAVLEENSIGFWLLNTVKLPIYIAAFTENNITIDILKYLTKEDLKNMGVISVGHQIAILQHAKAMNERLSTKEGISEETVHI